MLFKLFTLMRLLNSNICGYNTAKRNKWEGMRNIQKENNTQFIDTKELAARWRRSPSTIENWRSNGKGPKYLKLGGRVLYSLEEITSYEEKSIASGNL